MSDTLLSSAYRHRVKPDDYWLPGAVHSVGPLVWTRRTWGRYLGPDGRPDAKGRPYPIGSVEAFNQGKLWLCIMSDGAAQTDSRLSLFREP